MQEGKAVLQKEGKKEGRGWGEGGSGLWYLLQTKRI